MNDSIARSDADDAVVVTSSTEFQFNARDAQIRDLSLPDDADLHFIRARFFEIALEVSRLRVRLPAAPG